MHRAILLLAAIGSIGCSRALTDGAVAPSRRAAIERSLTAEPMRTEMHGSTATQYSLTRYGSDGRVRVYRGTLHHSERGPIDFDQLAPRTGTFEVLPNGALEERWGNWVTRQSGLVTDRSPLGSPAFVAGAFYEIAARRGTYHHEDMSRHDERDGFHVVVELSFGEPLHAPAPFEPITCEVLVHLRAQLLSGHETREAEAVDVYLPCRVLPHEHEPRVTFDGKSSLGDALEPWLRPHASEELRFLVRDKTPRVLTFSPADPAVLWSTR